MTLIISERLAAKMLVNIKVIGAQINEIKKVLSREYLVENFVVIKNR